MSPGVISIFSSISSRPSTSTRVGSCGRHPNLLFDPNQRLKLHQEALLPVSLDRENDLGGVEALHGDRHFDPTFGDGKSGPSSLIRDDRGETDADRRSDDGTGRTPYLDVKRCLLSGRGFRRGGTGQNSQRYREPGQAIYFTADTWNPG
jgi:hypothetical protein